MKFITVLCIPALLLLGACTRAAEKETVEHEVSGEKLARLHCSGCHAFPDPHLLDKKIWRDVVLPRMGAFLGMYEPGFDKSTLFEITAGGDTLTPPALFPAGAVIDSAAWKHIKEYFLTLAPDTLSVPVPAIEYTPRFRAVRPGYFFSPPSVTHLSFTGAGFVMADANSKSLNFFNSRMELLSTAGVGEGAVHTQWHQDQLYVTVMGSFSPTDAASGYILRSGKDLNKFTPVLSNLHRPVHSTVVDLNNDGLDDLLVCEYGKYTGCLAYYKNTGRGEYEKIILRNRPGAIRTVIRDMNKDGLPDVVALFGQGDEGVFVYYNEKNGKFREQRLLSFPPSYGSSYFDLVDMDKDGEPEIMYVNGDNADYRPVLKPYHGVHFYKNMGNGMFEEKYFHHVNGAYKAVAEDFDADGDVDLAVISFFPDFEKTPNESFLYLENQGGVKFKPFTFPEAGYGRWMVMDAGDIDRDGDLDLLLGSFTFEVVNDRQQKVKQWVEKGIPFVLLENLTR